MEIGVGRWANKARAQGCRDPKLINGTKRGIDASGFASSVVGKQKPERPTVRYAWQGRGSGGERVTLCSVRNVGKDLTPKNGLVEVFTEHVLR